jgi:hypothetical protein
MQFTCPNPNCNSHELFAAYTAQTQTPVMLGMFDPPQSSKIVAGSESFSHYFCQNCGYVLPVTQDNLMLYLQQQQQQQQKNQKAIPQNPKSDFNGTIVVTLNDDPINKFLVIYYQPDDLTKVDYAQLIKYSEELTQLLFQYPNATIKFDT